ncbi:MAG: hypothetical protein ACOVO0_09950 [Burkholderiaceae bacterium]
MSVFHRFVRLTRLQRLGRALGCVAVCLGLALPARAQVIELVWMGGDDCPPCAAWKRQELPRFAATPEGRSIRITGVDKPIRSPVPAAEALPPAARVYKTQLDEASAGRSGSPQMALMVDGKVYDYFFGSRSAELLVEMVQAVRTGSPYPVPRCLKLGPRGHQCDKPA